MHYTRITILSRLMLTTMAMWAPTLSMIVTVLPEMLLLRTMATLAYMLFMIAMAFRVI